MNTRNYIVSENEELKAEKIQLQSSTIQAQDSVIDRCTKGCAADNENRDSDVQPSG